MERGLREQVMGEVKKQRMRKRESKVNDMKREGGCCMGLV